MKRRVFIGKYDPAKRPFPVKSAGAPFGNTGPTGNSRNQRRQRARLSFTDQRALALTMGFSVPEFVLEKNHALWIARWEAAYAQR